MFDCFRKFVKRHQRKLVFMGVLSSGVFFGLKYVQYKVAEFRVKEARANAIYARKQHHFTSNQKTCNCTALSMLPNLRECLLNAIDTETLTRQLKISPENQLQIWNQLKLLSFTRTISAVYLCSMLALLLRVQLNVIGAYIYRDKFIEKTSDIESETDGPTLDIQERLLAVVEHLLGEGLRTLSEHVKSAVTKAIGIISLKEKLTSQRVQNIIHQVRFAVECDCDAGPTGTPSCHKLATFILPPEDKPDVVLSSRSSEDILFNKMLSEIRDIVESDDFHTVLFFCFDLGFMHLNEKLSENFSVPYTAHPPSRANLSEVEIPMAKFIPIINKQVYHLCSNTPNRFFQKLLMMNKMTDLAANIYEAFTHEPEITPPPRHYYFF
ncbi:peroxisomal biogenesis factor 3-like isoform X1 [Octopus sinensis]|uniref:Peroxisomal biogenesis factor 3 n=1 Tax=Octopus sinensis TaxID=2607531 RepID=A0A6P7SNZ1_9MOLL|nr:peroxisomal biogenesis factor 3-like isoform X1 [Octopus sinensis]